LVRSFYEHLIACFPIVISGDFDMALDFSNPKKILIIHGVQRGDNDDQTQDSVIKASVENQLDSLGLPFSVDIFKYEDINDQATGLLQRALSALTGNIISGWAVEGAVDIIGDVAIALSEGDTYDEIKAGFRSKILESYEKGEPLFVVAHSLGSIYAFDVINELMKEDGVFLHNQVETRPVSGLITIGSPLALDLFERDWQDMTNLVPANQAIDDNFRLFPWRNYWDPTDPIVSGSIVGLPWNERQFKEKFGDKPFDLGWDVRSRSVITGKAHILAHTAYWTDPGVALGIRQLIVRNGRG
jgi:hypothetical protein